MFSVWAYIVANTVKGRVELNPALLVAVIGCPRERIESAIEFLKSPDPRSRSKTHDGRRIIQEGEFQYFVPNHEHYRTICNEDERREYNKVMKRKERQVESMCASLTINDESAVSAQAEANTDSEAKTKKISSRKKLPDSEFIEALKKNEAYKNIDINKELSKMDGWILAHPGRQKTRGFIINWLNRIDTPIGKILSPTPKRPSASDYYKDRSGE